MIFERLSERLVGPPRPILGRIVLRDHQKLAVEQLDSGKILCGGVGSGKSRAAIAYFVMKECGGSLDIQTRHEMKTPKDLYIITTAKKRDSMDWDAECVLFGIGSDPDHNPNGVSYQVDSWNNLHKYVGVKDSFFIFDEQRLVGSGSWVKSFLKIAKDNRWILLSATPADTWLDYIPVFVANGFYKNRTEFKREHVVYSTYTKYPKVLRYLGLKKLGRFRDSVLVDMPVVRHTTRHIHWRMVEYDLDLWKEVVKKRWNVWKNEPVTNVAQLFYLMRKVCNSDVSRIEAVVELMEKHPKLIIFYNFDYELEILRNLSELVTIAEWNGHRHEDIPEGSRWVYLVQYQSGAEGWNCIETDAVVFYSLNYSYRLWEQAQGRIDRLNTPFEDLYYYCLRSSSPIDVAVLKALRSKKSFNERSSGLKF